MRRTTSSNKAINKAFTIALPSETEFIAMLKNELAQINQHVEGCIGTMASVTPDASFLELSQCSAGVIGLDCLNMSYII